VPVTIAEPTYLISASGREISHSSLFWILQIGGWGVYGLMMLGYTITRETEPQAILDTLQMLVTGFVLTLMFRYFLRRWRRAQTSPLRFAALVIALSVVGVPLWFEPEVLFSHILLGINPALVSWNPPYFPISLGIWLNWGIVLLSWCLIYCGINSWSTLQLERRRTAAAESMAQSARMQALQSQLQPHFLFNTLNSISTLVVDGQHELALSMISRLGDFLRLSLQTSETPQIPIEREIAFVSHYLDIQRIRFGDRLKFRIDLAPKVRSALVPTLLLQPLIENAVLHGILPHREGGSVTVVVRADNEMLKLRIEDDGPGFRTTAAPQFGVGLSNTAKRLDELYGERARMVVGRGAVSGVVIDIELPLVLALEREFDTPVESAQESAHAYPHALSR
jgi:two-component system, LytTR family, sensor kinase